MAEYTVYEYHSYRWIPQDSIHFLRLCKFCMQIVTHTANTVVVPHNGSDPLNHFKETFFIISELLDRLRKDPVGLELSIILYLCADIYELILAQPSYKQDLRTCVEILLDFHAHPPQSVQISEEILLQAEAFQYRDKLVEMCHMYGLACPETLPLLSHSRSGPLTPSVNHSDTVSFYTTHSGLGSRSSPITFYSFGSIHPPSRNSTESQGSRTDFDSARSGSTRYTLHDVTEAQSSSLY